MRVIILFLFCWWVGIGFSYAQSQKNAPIIFDSDMGPDYDDVGAIAMLHAFADRGDIKILATMASTKYNGVAAVLNVFNTYFNRADIPVGVPKGNAQTLRDWQHWSDTLMANYPHAIKTNDQAEDAVTLYRKILAGQKDHSVTIVTIGFLTNLSGLLQSKSDAYSGLDGRQLVDRKVKRLVCMAGKFPEGFEFNVDKDIPSSRYVFDNWPTGILFSGFEIGMKIKVGLPLVQNARIRNSPVKDVFRISIPMAREDSAGRMSWDETAVLVAALGYALYFRLNYGHILVNEEGKNSWVNDVHGKQAYLLESASPAKLQALINAWIMHQPKK